MSNPVKSMCLDSDTVSGIDDYLQRIERVSAVVREMCSGHSRTGGGGGGGETDHQHYNDNDNVVATTTALSTMNGSSTVIISDPTTSIKKVPELKHTARYSADYTRFDRMSEDGATEAGPSEGQNTSSNSNKKAWNAEAVMKDEAERSRKRGNDLFKNGNYKEALESYNQACVLDEKNVVHFLNRAMANLKLSRWASTISDCDVVLQAEGHNAKALFRRATALQNLGRFEEALSDWEKVSHVDPRGLVEHQQHIVQCRKELDARKVVDKARERDPKLLLKLELAIQEFCGAVNKCLAADLDTELTKEQAASGASSELSATDSKDSAQDRFMSVFQVLSGLGVLPSLLSKVAAGVGQRAAWLFFRVQGALAAVLLLAQWAVRHLNDPSTVSAVDALQNSTQEGRTPQMSLQQALLSYRDLISEGCFTLLALVLQNDLNLTTFVESEQKTASHVSAQETQCSALLHFAVNACQTKSPKSVYPSTLHFLSVATEHEWIQSELRRLLSSTTPAEGLLQLLQKVTSTSGNEVKSGARLGYAVAVLDHCLRNRTWQQDFVDSSKATQEVVRFAVEILEFLPDHMLLRQHITAAVMRLTTITCFRNQLLLCKPSKEVPEVSSKYSYFFCIFCNLFNTSIQPTGTKSVRFLESSAYMMEAILASLFNCVITASDELQQQQQQQQLPTRWQLCELLLRPAAQPDCCSCSYSKSDNVEGSVLWNCIAVITSYALAQQPIPRSHLPVLCRSLGLLSKCMSSYPQVRSHPGLLMLRQSGTAKGHDLVTFIMALLAVIRQGSTTTPFGECDADEEGATPAFETSSELTSSMSYSGAQYNEIALEYTTVLIALFTSQDGKTETCPGDDVVFELISKHWELLVPLVSHPQNLISGNAALILCNLLNNKPQRARVMGEVVCSEDDSDSAPKIKEVTDEEAEKLTQAVDTTASVPQETTTTSRPQIDLTQLLLQTIISKRNEDFLHQGCRRPRNTPENNHGSQINCGVTLAKLSQHSPYHRIRLRQLQGVEILHQVLLLRQQKLQKEK